MSARKVADANCVVAAAAGAFDIYLGDSTVAMLSNSSFYLTSGPSTKYGWSGAPCLVNAAAMCEMVATTFPCPSPSPPPEAPDAPAPFPPSAPLEASCELLESRLPLAIDGSSSPMAEARTPSATQCP